MNIKEMFEDMYQGYSIAIFEICFILTSDINNKQIDYNKRSCSRSDGAPTTDSIETDPVNTEYIFVEN